MVWDTLVCQHQPAAQADSKLLNPAYHGWPTILLQWKQNTIILPAVYKPQGNAAMPRLQESLQASASVALPLSKLQRQVGQRAGRKATLNLTENWDWALRGNLSWKTEKISSILFNK